MKTKQILIGAILALTALAHFQVLIPGTDLVGAANRTVNLRLLFTHPMAGGPVMEMGKPVQFGLLLKGTKTDLTGELRPRKLEGKTAYDATYQVKQPGDHIFYLEPAPYWEPLERKMIVHYTKVVVSAFGEEDGWDATVGFPVEIEPLVRPYGLWTGNSFRGIVRKDGKPVPFAEVEVEYWNPDHQIHLPDTAFVTQVVKADTNGTFSYTMPRAGWWAFAALVDGDTPMKNPAGEDVEVELGGLIWVHCVDMGN